jgi:hypothetical protein
MHSDWKGPFSRRLQRKRSERGRRMANRRWDLYRERRNRLAQVTAEMYPNKIVRRIIVIDREQNYREAVIFKWDSDREARLLRSEQRHRKPPVKSQLTLL